MLLEQSHVGQGTGLHPAQGTHGGQSVWVAWRVPQGTASVRGEASLFQVREGDLQRRRPKLVPPAIRPAHQDGQAGPCQRPGVRRGWSSAPRVSALSCEAPERSVTAADNLFANQRKRNGIVLLEILTVPQLAQVALLCRSFSSEICQTGFKRILRLTQSAH